MKEHYHIRVFPPGHPEGYAKLFTWQVRSPGDVEMAGTNPDRQNAMEAAGLALEMVMERKK
jgi:hypothetical protein